jgi:hypothetical protein
MHLTIEKLENIIKDQLKEIDLSSFLKSTKHKLAQTRAHSKTGLDFDQIGSGIAGNVAKHGLPDLSSDEEEPEDKEVKTGQLDLPMDMPVTKDRKIPLDLQRLQKRYYELMTDTSVGRRSNADEQELIKIQSILPRDLRAKIDKQIADQKAIPKQKEPVQGGLFDAPPVQPTEPVQSPIQKVVKSTGEEETDTGRPEKTANKKEKVSKAAKAPKAPKAPKVDYLTALFDKVYKKWDQDPSRVKALASLQGKEKDIFLGNNALWTQYLAKKNQEKKLQERWKKLAGILKG